MWMLLYFGSHVFPFIRFAASQSLISPVIKQSFHWFSTSKALRSIARVLGPDASFALIWNIEDYNNTVRHDSPHPWTFTLRRLLFDLDKLSPSDTPILRFRNETWRQIFSEAGGPFAPTQEKQFPWTTWLDREALWSRVHTLWQIAALEGEELMRTRRLFDDALDGDGTEVNEQGKIAVRGSTLVVWTTKL